MSDTSAPPKLTPGALVFGALGLVAFAVSLVVPWYDTVTFEGSGVDTQSTDAFAFGMGSGLYLAGVPVVAGFAVATLATRGAVRSGLGGAGLIALSAPVAALFLVGRRLHEADVRMLEMAAEVSREDPPSGFVTPHAGPFLAALALFLLALALARFAWPDRSIIGYAIASAAAVELVLVLPWASRDAIFADRVQIVDYWFPYFGVLGLLGAVGAVVALMSAIFTVVLVPRTWWPPLAGLVSAIGSMVAAGFVNDDSDVTPDPNLADALFENVVINSGIPALCAFVGAVMFACTLAVAIVQYRRARRATPPKPQFLSTQQW